MKYKLICNECGDNFEAGSARYFCNKCRDGSRKLQVGIRTEIETLLKEGGFKQADIAKKYDVSPGYISKIKASIGLGVAYKELN